MNRMFKCMDVFGMWKEILPVYCDGLTNSFCVFGMCKEILPVYFDELAISFFFECSVCECKVFC